jgi:hypothetical protein
VNADGAIGAEVLRAGDVVARTARSADGSRLHRAQPSTAAGHTRLRLPLVDLQERPMTLARLNNQTLQLRFTFAEGGALFAFWVSRGMAGESGGYVAAGGPAFNGARDVGPLPLAARSPDGANQIDSLPAVKTDDRPAHHIAPKRWAAASESSAAAALDDPVGEGPPMAGPYHVAYSSRLPRPNKPAGWRGECFTTTHAFATTTVDWAGKHAPPRLCDLDDPPVEAANATFCFTDPAAVKACLDAVPAGRRAIHLQGGIFLYGPSGLADHAACGGWADLDAGSPRGCTLWADRWQGIVARRFDDWFRRCKGLGGGVDVILLDVESKPRWQHGEFTHGAADLARVTGDLRWPAVRAQLNARGAAYGVAFDTVSDIATWAADPADFRQWVWTEVILARRGAYLNFSLYEPACKHFPAVKGSDYDHSMRPSPGPRWAYAAAGVSKPSVCCGSHVGTQQTRAYYGWSLPMKPEIVWSAPRRRGTVRSCSYARSAPQWSGLGGTACSPSRRRRPAARHARAGPTHRGGGDEDGRRAAQAGAEPSAGPEEGAGAAEKRAPRRAARLMAGAD